MKIDVFGYGKGQKPSPDWLKQGIVFQWEGEKKQMWLWGFTDIDKEAVIAILTAVLEDIKK